MVETIYATELLDDLHLMRRLHAVRTLGLQVPASVQFDIARTPLQFDGIEAVTESFGVQAQPKYGFADRLGELLTAQPHKVPVKDLQKLQENLQAQGYLPADYVPSGTWDAESHIAFSRMDRDAYDMMRSGKAFPAQDQNAAIRFITNTLPAQVWQGMVGIAKGLVLQTPETLSRTGALGGMAGGAMVGGMIGGLPGAGIGAGVGAVAGFIGDLISDDEGEEDQGFAADLLDALTPFEEYTGQGGLGRFFEDLGYFGTASSVVGGAKLGFSLVQGGRAAIAANQAAGVTGMKALTTANELSVMNPAGAPVSLVRMAAGMKRLESVAWLQSLSTRMSLSALSTKPIMQVVSGAYTGVETATMAGRLTAGFDFGTGQAGTTTIEKAIAETEPLNLTVAGLPLFRGESGLDIASFLLMPTRFLPFGLKNIAASTGKLMGDTAMVPFAMAIQHNTPGVGFREALRIARDDVFSGPEGIFKWEYLWLESGIRHRAAEMVMASHGSAFSQPMRSTVPLKTAKAQLIGQIKRELAATGESPLAQSLIALAKSDPKLMAADLIAIVGKGSGLERMKSWTEALDYVHDVERRLKDAAYVEMPDGRMVNFDEITKARKGAGPVTRPSGTATSRLEEQLDLPEAGGVLLREKEIPMTPGKTRAGMNRLRYASIRQQVKKLEAAAKVKDSKARRIFRDDLRAMLRQEADDLRLQAGALKAEMKEMRLASTQVPKTIEQMRLGLMRLDEFTQRDYYAAAEKWKKLRKQWVTADRARNFMVADGIKAEMVALAQDLEAKGYILMDDVSKVITGGDPGLRIADTLISEAKVAARDVELPAQDMEWLKMRDYKPVWTGEEVLYPTDMGPIASIVDLPHYSKISNFIQLLGMDPAFSLEESLAKLRREYTISEINKVLDRTRLEHGIETPWADGEGVVHALYQWMRKHNEAGTVKGPLVVYPKGSGERWGELFKFDLRQLTPRQIYSALDKYPGFDINMANDIYGALRKGAAWGGEMKLLHPIESARAVGRAMRVTGLPGFSDVIRSWHSGKEMWRASPKELMEGAIRNNVLPDLARSKERARFLNDLSKLGAKGSFTPGEIEVEKTMFDVAYSIAKGADPDLTPDAFFGKLSAEWLRSYSDTKEAGGLFQRVWATPRIEALVKIAEKHKELGESWYQVSGDAIRATFGGLPVTLRNGATIDGSDLMMRVLAVTSGGELPKSNLTKALKAVQQFMDNPQATKFGVRDSGTLNRVFDGWVPDTRKYGPFYRALMGDPDAVVIDRRMALMFGFGPGFTPKEQQFMENIVRDVAKRSGVSPSIAQARMWVGFADHFDNLARAYKTKDAALAEQFRQLAAGVRKDPDASGSYADFLLGRSKDQAESLRRAMREVGATKVVDAEGNPLRVYHGTTETFEQFDPVMEKGGLLGQGFYFAEDPAVTAKYAGALPQAKTADHFDSELGAQTMARNYGVSDEIRDMPEGRVISESGLYRDPRGGYMLVRPTPTWTEGGNVRAHYLDIRNPLDVTARWDPNLADRIVAHLRKVTAEELPIDDLAHLLERPGRTNLDLYHRVQRWLDDEYFRIGDEIGYEWEAVPELNQVLKELGYDGIFHIGEQDGRVWVAFDPASVKPGYVQSPAEVRAAKLVEDYGQNPAVLAQIVEGQIRGMVELGKDGAMVLRAFQHADFGTLAHEGGHILRQVLPDSTRVKIEAAIGVRPIEDLMEDFTPVPTIPVTDDHLVEMVRRARSAEHNNGFTFDPHTGEFLEGPAGFGVGLVNGSAKVIPLPDEGDITRLREIVEEVSDDFRKEFGNERVKLGGYVDDGKLHIDPSEVIEDIYEAQTRAALRDQLSIYDFRGSLHSGQFIPISDLEKEIGKTWTRQQEEAFANFIQESVMGTFSGKGPQSEVRNALGHLYHKLRPWANERGYIPGDLRAFYDKEFMGALKELGIQAPRKARYSKQALVGAAAGAAMGAGEGDEGFEDILKGAAWGTLGGIGMKKALQRTYGYLPDYLARLNTALRYTFSATFDAGRYMEQSSIAFMKYGLSPRYVFAPKRAIMAERGLSPFADHLVSGNEAWDHSLKLWDEVIGGGESFLYGINDMDRRLFQAGILGFSPRYAEAAQAMALYRRGMSPAQIKEAISWLGHYGLARTAADKSINFLFFPYSFSKKFLSTIGDFILQTPGRNLLIAEGFRRYHESQLDERFHKLVENHLPILEQLWMINNLAFGISPGRFAFEGLTDNRTKEGAAMQLLASFFVPSGAATPMQRAAGGLGDYAVHLFAPVVLTGESISRAGGVDSLDDLVRRYIPIVREVQTYTEATAEQWVAAKQGRTPWSQFQEYSEGLRDAKNQFAPLAMAMGYASADSFLSSSAGVPFQAMYEQERQALADKYPTGASMSWEFTNSAAMYSREMAELADRPSKTAGEEKILELLEQIRRQELLKEMGMLPPEIVDLILSKMVRETAMQWVNDARFAELYDRWLMREYGPIRRIQ